MRALLLALVVFTSLNVFAQKAPVGVEFKALPSDLIQGSKISNLNELKGKVVLIDFWASWCEPCKEALPHYNRLYKKYKDKGLVVIAINEDDDLKERDAFLKSHPLEFTIYFDKTKSMVKDFKVQALPSLFVIDKNLKPVALFRGFSEDKPQVLEKKIQELLK
ncbi:TlpA disulfide reductase family protein [Bdellovibrio sp. HCB-162]|uniref:TlpA disulfide reductase family protein n=1 Tax=Bdellovibrio sp. HCB-162 TaxID=3394234 RepID=UPI0039BC3B91